MDLAKMGLGIAGFAAGGALLYGSTFVPGKLKAIPVAGGLGAIAFGGWQVYEALMVEPADPSIPEDAQYIKTTITNPYEGQNIGWPWFVTINFNIINSTEARKQVIFELWQDFTVVVSATIELNIGSQDNYEVLKYGVGHIGVPGWALIALRDTTTGQILEGSGAQVSFNLV